MAAAVVLAALVAVLVAALLTPVARRLAVAVGAVDHPGGRRIHARITPRMGGVAVVAAYLAALGAVLGAGLLQRWIVDPSALGAFVAGGLLIALVGAADDVRPLGARVKLLGQVAAVSLAWWGGARVASTLFLPGLAPVEVPLWASYLVSVVWALAFINAVNLIDGLDGLAAGVVLFASITNLVVAVVTGNGLAAVLNAALGGAVIGFLFYNFNPATIFLGDTGSLFLGFALGTASLLTGRQKESTLVSLLVPLIALGLPLTDTLLAMLRRVLARRSIFQADRGHMHHRLLDLGLTQRRAVLLLYACSLLLCVAAIAAALGKDWQVGAALAAALLTLVGITRFAGYFELLLLRSEEKKHLLEGHAAILRTALPELVRALVAVGGAPAVWLALERLVSRGFVTEASFTPAAGAAPSWHWEASGITGEGKLVEAAFAIRCRPEGEPGQLRFRCLTPAADLPPHVIILLQLVADAVEEALCRPSAAAGVGAGAGLG